MLPKKALQMSFAAAIIKALEQRYHRLPSAAFVAKEFNLRAAHIEPIAQETARRWLRGLAVPGLDKLIVLRIWLDLDLNLIGSTAPPHEPDLQGAQVNLVLNREEFSQNAQLIKETLHKLMSEIQDLETKLRSRST